MHLSERSRPVLKSTSRTKTNYLARTRSLATSSATTTTTSALFTLPATRDLTAPNSSSAKTSSTPTLTNLTIINLKKPEETLTKFTSLSTTASEVFRTTTSTSNVFPSSSAVDVKLATNALVSTSSIDAVYTSIDIFLKSTHMKTLLPSITTKNNQQPATTTAISESATTAATSVTTTVTSTSTYSVPNYMKATEVSRMRESYTRSIFEKSLNKKRTMDSTAKFKGINQDNKSIYVFQEETNLPKPDHAGHASQNMCHTRGEDDFDNNEYVINAVKKSAKSNIDKNNNHIYYENNDNNSTKDYFDCDRDTFLAKPINELLQDNKQVCQKPTNVLILTSATTLSKTTSTITTSATTKSTNRISNVVPHLQSDQVSNSDELRPLDGDSNIQQQQPTKTSSSPSSSPALPPAAQRKESKHHHTIMNYKTFGHIICNDYNNFEGSKNKNVVVQRPNNHVPHYSNLTNTTASLFPRLANNNLKLNVKRNKLSSSLSTSLSSLSTQWKTVKKNKTFSDSVNLIYDNKQTVNVASLMNRSTDTSTPSTTTVCTTTDTIGNKFCFEAADRTDHIPYIHEKSNVDKKPSRLQDKNFFHFTEGASTTVRSARSVAFLDHQRLPSLTSPTTPSKFRLKSDQRNLTRSSFLSCSLNNLTTSQVNASTKKNHPYPFSSKTFRRQLSVCSFAKAPTAVPHASSPDCFSNVTAIKLPSIIEGFVVHIKKFKFFI
ncbi:hypothetical protein HELRODRAFT_165995 [Helobdella robusta]|uniref:Uncharacterized protein n=1 Tax=Helobdella robusta TaxID=6412 RepID=T1EXJ8_HELRO|nr:hypothetical protein HELRODRAFT_165995 [Helobdella robusta]ESN90336.1 hypothetical protein HELRODRAFT_165995 [Helobdella robusta]